MPENLASAYEEVFTVIDRLNAGRQAVSDAGSFRQQVRDGIAMSERRAREAGYAPEDITLATFAIAALLDAAILRLQDPVFRDWPKKPLGEELFGSFNAGETFFTNIQRLSREEDSPRLADALEIYELCILLGFEGRHGVGTQGELRAIREGVAERIRRIRSSSELSSAWRPPQEGRKASGDPWIKPLLWTAIAACVVAAVLFGFYSISLNSGASEVPVVTERA